MKWWSVALSLVVLLWGETRTYAAGDIFEQASLQGLKAVQVVVENLAPDVSQDGLDRSQIKTAVEQQLERARLAREDTLGRESMSTAERRWLETNRSPLARHWNLLTGLTPDQLSYAP